LNIEDRYINDSQLKFSYLNSKYLKSLTREIIYNKVINDQQLKFSYLISKYL